MQFEGIVEDAIPSFDIVRECLITSGKKAVPV
jgi:hypothetical protein